MEEEHSYNRKSSTRIIFNYSVISAVLLIGFSVFYYFVVFLPGKEKINIQQEESRQALIDSCLQKAYESYKTRWDSACKLDSKEEGCILKTSRSEIVNAYHKELKDECYKRYP